MPAYRVEKVLLLGMMGSGKTTVGAALSTRLGWPYLDNDAMLVRTAGRSAAEIAAADGEQALRTAESKVLTFMLGMPAPMIAGVAAGVVLAEADRLRIMESPAHVVWLRASPKVLARRLGSGAGRPWLDGDPEAALRKLAAERNPHYEEVADQVVDVDALAAGMIAKQIVEQITLP
ncbi:MAG: shikimate kinase [Frankiales bacterium]|nr:shikimate kinase [Frankiales bacterium]